MLYTTILPTLTTTTINASNTVSTSRLPSGTSQPSVLNAITSFLRGVCDLDADEDVVFAVEDDEGEMRVCVAGVVREDDVDGEGLLVSFSNVHRREDVPHLVIHGGEMTMYNHPSADYILESIVKLIKGEPLRDAILNPEPEVLDNDQGLHHMFLDAARAFPARVAIRYLDALGSDQETWTYAELAALSSRVANRLPPGKTGVVAVCLPQPHHPLFYASILGVQRRGYAYCPIVPGVTPPERVKFLLSDMSATAVLTTSTLKAEIEPIFAGQVFLVDDLLSTKGELEEVVDGEAEKVAKRQTGYVLYTSGSTGLPKGVQLSHRNAVNAIRAHYPYFPSSSTPQRFLQFASVTFDVSLLEIYLPLSLGWELVTAPSDVLHSDLAATIAELGVEHMELTPTVASLVSAGECPSVKSLMTIGEMLTPRVVDNWCGVPPHGVQLHNAYGPTETAIHCSCSWAFGVERRCADIGIPLSTCAMMVMDFRTPNLLPVGYVGELVVGGPQVSELGYLNREALNKEVFFEWDGMPVYRTGDKGRILPDGRMECLGRVGGGQVKVRGGQRVELGEVSFAVQRSLADSMAEVISFVADEGELVTFVVGEEEEGGQSEEDVRRGAGRWVPGYMVPGVVRWVEAVPKTASGKTDMKAVKAMYAAMPREANPLDAEHERDDESEWTPREERVRDAIVEVAAGVEVSQVRKGSELRVLGVDSIGVIKLIAGLRKKGVEGLAVSDVVRAGTVANIAALIKDGGEAEHAEDVDAWVGLTRLVEGAESVMPATPIQEAMIAETVKDAEGKRYYNWVLLEIAEGVEASIVEQAWKSLVEANQALRSGFVVSPEDVKEAEFLQVVYPASHPVDFSVEDGEVERVVNKHKEVTLTIESMRQPPLSARLVNGKWLSVMIYHGLFDGWAMESIVRDLAAYISEPTAIISRPQFRKVTEYAKRERDSTPARTYWTELLKDVQPVQMPNLTGRRFVPKKIAHEKLSLKSSVEDVEAFARSRGITPQVLLQTAWAWLLGMYTESKDVVFGTVVSGRTIPVAGVEDVIGVCINTLPTRVGLEATKTIAEVFRSLQKDGTDVLEHVDLPLRAVKALAGVEAAETLFDTILVYQKTLYTGDEQSAVVKQVDGEDRLEYTVLVEAEATGNELELRVTFEQAKLPAEQCRIMLAQLDALVDGLMRMEPTSTLDELVSMLGQGLVSVVPAEPAFETMKDEPKTMHEMFELTAKNFPEKVAIEVATDFVDGTPKSSVLTYEQLNARANQVANYLVSEGSCVEEIVAINMDRSIHMYVAILAVLKAGGAYMPIIPQAPKDRVEHMISATECRFCLTTSSDDKSVASHLPASVMIIEVDVMDLSAQSQGNVTRGVDPSALAYVFFTSGTTGTPKGVCVEHGNVVHNLAALSHIYPYGPESRFLQFSTFHFDVSVFEIFFAWKTGMVLCTARQDLLLRDLEAAFRALRATHSNLTPTAAGLLHRDNVPSLEVLICAGEEVTDKIVSEWHGRRLFNGYGPTEATNICHLYDQVPADASGGNIGRVVPMTSAYILSNDLKPVPRGAVGELCVGGPQVTRGYLKMPELTAQKFFELEGAGRVYKTGDFARLLPDGSFYFLGRRDGQVKIRGFRIELGEISASLSKSKKVNEAITVVVGSGKQSQIVSFVVPTASMSQKCEVVSTSTGYDVPSFVKELFDAAQQALPYYMVPSAIVLVSHLPLGSTNKVDKAQLLEVYSGIDSCARDIFTAGSAAEDNDGGDWSDVEISLRDALANVSGVDVVDIGRSTSIYKLGLDSISAIRLSQRLRKVGFHQLDVSQIMRNPTIRQLAAVVSKTVRTESSGTDRFTRGEEVIRAFADRNMHQILQSLELSEVEIEDILICTPLQEGMLGDSSRFQGSYYNHAVHEVTAGVDLKRLEAAWRVIVERHPMMRTCFCITEDPHHPFAQVVLKNHQLPWSVTEVSGNNLPAAVDEHIVRIGAALDIRRPPYHFGVLRAGDKTVIVHSVHHAIYDGWANGLVDDDVKQLYAGGNLRRRPAFRRVLEYIASTDETESIRFWKQNLEGYEPTGFPDLSGQSTLAKGRDESVIISKSSSLSRGELDAGCQALSTTLLAVVQSAWTRILTSYLDSMDVVFGNVVSGRTLPIDDVQEIAGPCFNTIPVRATLSNTTTNRELVQLLQNVNAESLPHQHTSLRKIIKSWDESSGKKLFDTLIIFQNATDPQRDSVNLWKLIDDRAQMDFIAAIEFMPSNESLEIQLSTWKSHMPQEQANVLLEQLDCAIVDVLKHPDSQVADFSAALPNKLLSISNSDAAAISVGYSTFLHTNLERYAQEVPDRVALEFWDGKELREWTYAQLNAEANKVANYLIELGVKRDEAVPLCMEKSPQLYICILGILKAGAAFTPLDTSAPIDRKVFMITELEARFLITTTDKESSLLRTNLPNLNVIQLPHAAITQQSIENPSVPDLKPSNLAYILYTSGSTGRPKAVAVEIRNAVQAVLASRCFFWWNDTSKLLQFAAPTFDMSIYDCMISWNFGIRLCSATRKLLLSDLHGVIQRMNVTHLDLTPTIASSLIRSEVPTVEMLFCIGEALPQDLVEQWSPICINAYGPTECAMACTHQISMPHMKSNNIGKPFESTSFYILTKDTQHVVPVHGVGELCIGGFQVARGYHANPTMTEDRFITREGVEGRLYLTGDLVRVLASGEFEFLGRADDQVKIRGLRVELGEINAVARDADSSIVDAVTLVLKHPKMLQDQLVTFLALQPRDDTIHDCAAVTDNALRLQLTEKCLAEAKRRLPAYMIPGIVLLVDRIPLSAAGKVNRRLLTFVFTDMEMADFQIETKDEDEVWGRLDAVIREALAQIALVPLQDVRKSSTIFQLGLDSISAVQVAARLSKQLHREVSVLDVLQNPSIRELSAFLENASFSSEATVDDIEGFNADISVFRGEVESDLDAIPRGLQAILPCTPLQEGMLAQFIRSNGKEYFNSVLFELEASIDTDRLRSAWNSCFEDFDILRTGFCAINGTRHSYAQLVYERAALELPWSKHHMEDLSRLDAFVEQRRSDLAQKVMDALEGPPINLDLISGSDKSMYLLFSAHHALFDAWSLGLLLETVYAHYHGFATPERSKSASVLRSILSGEYDEAWSATAKTFWKSKLEGISPSIFPNLTSKRLATTGSFKCIKTSKVSFAKMEAACKSLNVQVQTLGQAAWAKLLSAYSGETHVIFGQVLSGRAMIKGGENAVFPCLTTVPCAFGLNGSNKDFVQLVQKYNSDSLQYQHTSLTAISQWLGFTEGETLFDTIFLYQKAPAGSVNLRENELWREREHMSSVDYAVSLEMEPMVDGSVSLVVHAKDSLMSAHQGQLLLEQFDALLEGIIDHPEAQADGMTVADDNLLSISPPQHEILDAPVQYLHHFVEMHAKLMPGKVALEFATGINGSKSISLKWTYAELNEEGNRIAHYLRSTGVKPNTTVPVCFDKSPIAFFSILGVLKAGCSFLALDPGAPMDRRAFIVEDISAVAVLTTERYADAFRSNTENVNIIAVDVNTEISLQPSDNLDIPELVPESLAYILYTSGSTGTPKGCEISHDNAVQAMQAFSVQFAGHWDSESKFLCFASLHFDVSILEQYWTWSVGIAMVAADRDVLFQDLPLALRALRITHLDLTPSLAVTLQPADVPLLRVFITGGELLRREVLDSWGKTGKVFNAYGPTEVTIGCTMLCSVPEDARPSNIGKQFVNCGSFVVKAGKGFTPVLRGAVGELCMSGKLVGRGYVKRPELTAERFLEVPEHNVRVYRTGDLVRLLDDGSFDFIGRADEQVKLRGQRLELGEINATLKQAGNGAAVVDAATLVLRHPSQQKDQLVSFIVPASTETAVAVSPELIERFDLAPLLRQACKRRLPGYMVPTHILPVSKLPLSRTNKIDGKFLAALFHQCSLDLLQQYSGATNEDRVKAWTETGRRIQQLLARITKVPLDAIHPLTSIFELGLDSISAVNFARTLKKEDIGTVSVSQIMQNPCIMDMADLLETPSRDDSADILSTAKASIQSFSMRFRPVVLQQLECRDVDVESIYPCTPLQEGIIAEARQSDNGLYFNHFILRLEDLVDINKLHKALEVLIQSNAMLRTCFCDTEEGFAQVCLRWQNSNAKLWKEVILKDESVNEVAERLAKQFARDNKSLERPAFGINLVGKDGQKYLCLVLFHALYDGWSLPLLLDDLQRLYHGIQLPQRPPFEDVIPHILAADETKAKDHWRSALNGMSCMSFPVQHSDPSDTDVGRSDFAVEVISDCSVQDVEVAAQSKLSSTPQALLQAACSLLLTGYLGKDVSYGVVVSGRNIMVEGIENVVGPVFNTIPFAMHISEDASAKEIVQYVQTASAAASPFHHTPLRLIRKWLGVPREYPLFDFLFVYQKTPKNEEDNGAQLWDIVETDAAQDFSASLEIEQTAQGTFVLRLAGKGSALSPDIGRTMLKTYDAILSAIISAPNSVPAISFAELKEEHAMFSPRSQDIKRTSDKKSTSALNQSEEAQIIRHCIAEAAGLDVKQVDDTTSIFHLGLDSIEAIRLSTKLKLQNILLSVSELMKYSTVQDMLLLLNEKQANEIGSAGSQGLSRSAFDALCNKLRQQLAEEGVLPGDVRDVYPCTPLQEGMIAESVSSERTTYLNHAVLELDDGVDVEKLKQAWKNVLLKEAIFRTSFRPVNVDGVSYAQVVHKTASSWIEHTVQSLADLPEYCTKHLERTREVLNPLERPPVSVALLKAPEKQWIVLCLHHALYDGWSLSLLFETVLRQYHEVNGGSNGPSFKDVVNQIISADQSKAEQYWSRVLNDCTMVSFPDLSGSTAAESPVGSHWCEVNSALTASNVEEACKYHGITLQTVGQAAWSVILSLYTGESDVLFGAVLSGRNTMEGAEGVMGPTMNTVPVRVDVRDCSSLELLRKVHDSSVATFDYQHTPLRDVQRLARTNGRRLFDTIFLYQKSASQGSTTYTRPLWTSVDEESSTEYSVAVEMETKDDCIIWRATSKNALMTQDQTRLILLQLDAVVKNLVNKNACNAAVIGRDESKILAIDNASPAPLTTGGISLLHEFFEKNAALKPQHPALEFYTWLGHEAQTATFTYEKLNALANQVARLLVNKGVQPGDVVPISIHKGPFLYMGMLGILKAGGALLFVDPDMPQDRKSHMVSEVGAKVLLVTCETSNQALSTVELIELDPQQEQVSQLDTSNLNLAIEAQRTAYMIYTSGTTGTPKGVTITHTNAVQAILAFHELIPSKPDSRFLQFASAAFDVIHFECHYSWSLGITLCSAPKSDILSDLERALNTMRITHVDLTPSVSALVKRENVPTVEVLVSGGEALTQKVLEEWTDGGCLYNAYGPSEVTIGCTMLTQVPRDAKPMNIGKVWPNTSAYVLSSHLEVLPRGAIGELCVGGVQVAPGYFKRPDLTKERFINLFGERLYRTGDQVRMLADGSIEFCGRNDDQVKLNGIRIELGEIATVMAKSHEDINDAVCLVLRHRKSTRDQLVAFVSCTSQDVSSDEAKVLDIKASAVNDVVETALKATRRKLPTWMIPSHVVALSQFPRGRTSKTDRKALADIFSSMDLSASDDENVVEDWQSQELILRDVLAEISTIPVESIRRTSTIFTLGLDSISAIRISGLLRRQSINLTVAEILQNPTIERMSEHLTSRRAEQPAGEATDLMARLTARLGEDYIDLLCAKIGLSKDNVENVAPCTPSQTYTLSAWQNSNQKLFMPSFPYITKKKLDGARLRKTFEDLVKRHDGLRTVFASTSDADFPLLQFMLKSYSPEFVEEDVGDVEDVAGAVYDLVVKESAVAVDLRTPPIRMRCVQFNDKTAIILTIHHALYDGWSLPALIKELADVYSGSVVVAPSVDFAKFTKSVYAVSESSLEKYWSEALSAYKPTHAPVLHASTSAFRTSVYKPRAILNAKALQDACRQKGLTLQSVFLAAFGRILAQRTQSNTATFGMYVSGRTPEFASLMAPTVNIIPLCVQKNEDLVKSAEEVQMELARGSEKQQVSLAQIAKWIGREGEALVNAYVNYLRFDDDTSTSPDENLFREVEIGNRMSSVMRDIETNAKAKGEVRTLIDRNPVKSTVKVDLDVEIAVRGDGVDVGIFCGGEVMNEEEVNTMLGELCGEVEKALKE